MNFGTLCGHSEAANQSHYSEIEPERIIGWAVQARGHDVACFLQIASLTTPTAWGLFIELMNIHWGRRFES